MGIYGHFRTLGKYSDFLAVFVIPGAPEIVSESISQQQQQNQSTMDAGEPKPSRRNDLSPPHQIFSDSNPLLEWEILSQTIPGTLADPQTGSVSRLLAWFCAKLCLQTKTLILNVLLIFAATNQRRDLWESPPCFDGTDEEFISKFEPKIDGP